MLTVEKSFAKVRRSAEKIKNNETQRFPEAASIGDVVRQGDIYIQLIKALPDGIVKSNNPQLAVGTTQGSRHILDSLDGVKLYNIKGATPLDGPVFKTTKERTITHPEHGDWILPAGCYKITYQRAFAEELRRQQD